MDVQTSIHPQSDDEPSGYINPGIETTHPFAVVYFGARQQGPHLSLGLLSDDDAVAFLDHLADVASGLAAKIRLHQAAAEVEPETADLAVWRVVCGCGYVVEGLRREAAERFALHHEDGDTHDPRLCLGNTSVVPS